jgi:predicted lipoprotein with Yx(FWY)xxD motif
MKTKKLSYLLIATSAIFLLFTASCKKDKNEDTPPDTKVTGVKLTATATLGNVITDNNGRSLYFFSRDAAATSTCVDGCAITWPVFYKENLEIGTGLEATDFGVITRADGSKQSTYKGWPLYYFMNDSNPGDTKGDALNNLWAVAKADYTIMFANAQLVGLDGAQYNDQGKAGVGSSQYVTDANGHTLYMFAPDTFNQNKFTKPDFSNDAVWPIYTVATVGSIPTVFDKTQFAIIDTHGRKQVSYKGRPLYAFGQDVNTRGNTKGVSFPTPGAAVWRVVNTTTIALAE